MCTTYTIYNIMYIILRGVIVTDTISNSWHSLQDVNFIVLNSLLAWNLWDSFSFFHQARHLVFCSSRRTCNSRANGFSREIREMCALFDWCCQYIYTVSVALFSLFQYFSDRISTRQLALVCNEDKRRSQKNNKLAKPSPWECVWVRVWVKKKSHGIRNVKIERAYLTIANCWATIDVANLMIKI